MSSSMRAFLFGSVLSGMVCAPVVGAETEHESADGYSLRQRQRLERLQALRQAVQSEAEFADTTEVQRPRGLRTQTVAGSPSPQAVANATDVALDIDADFDLGGFLFKGGVPFLHNDGGATYQNTALGLNALVSLTPSIFYGAFNTAVGLNALRNTTDGFDNTAIGVDALRYNSSGRANTAVGLFALRHNTAGENTAVGQLALYGNASGYANTIVGARAMANFAGANGDGFKNTAVGVDALNDNDTGDFNTAVGSDALSSSTTGSGNTAVGQAALTNNTNNYNTAVGYNAGYGWTTGQDNVGIGTGAYGLPGETQTIRIGGGNLQHQTFIEGIRDASYPLGYPFDEDVCINSKDQLGPCVFLESSARLKTDVEPMDSVASQLAALHPVRFRYKRQVSRSKDAVMHYGLIAEEVAQLFPHMVSYDDEGRPYTVRYELLTPLLLNQLQDEMARSESRDLELDDLRQQVAELRKVVGELKRRDEIQRE